MPQVSVIVPIFNGTSFLPAFFDSLAGALPGRSEVILIDDGSTEPVFDLVPELPMAEHVVRLRNGRNLGYSVAVNRGFDIARGEVVVQLNTDLVLTSTTITAMVDLIEREKDVGIVGSKLVFPTTQLIQHVGMTFGNYSKRHAYAELPADHPLCCKTRELQICTGATVAMTRRVLNHLGPLDERYFNQNEDIDHCLRAVAHGLRNFMCADSVAYHWESQSGPARFAQIEASEAVFWTMWGGRHHVDLGAFLDEALDHVVAGADHLLSVPFEVVDLSRGADGPIVLQRLAARWPGVEDRTRYFRQTNNPADRLWLPMLLPHWMVAEPTPFLYVVDCHRELVENAMWFDHRRRIVEDELIVDLNAVVVPASEVAHS